MSTPVNNFQISAQEILQVPKQLKKSVRYFLGGVCYKATAQTAEFWAMGIVSGTSRHPKDVPFVSEFWWGRTVWALSPHKKNRFRWSVHKGSKRAWPVLPPGECCWTVILHGSTRHAVFEPILQCVHRYTATHLVIIIIRRKWWQIWPDMTVLNCGTKNNATFYPSVQNDVLRFWITTQPLLAQLQLA